jgi:hypothetical protein
MIRAPSARERFLDLEGVLEHRFIRIAALASVFRGDACPLAPAEVNSSGPHSPKSTESVGFLAESNGSVL